MSFTTNIELASNLKKCLLIISKKKPFLLIKSALLLIGEKTCKKLANQKVDVPSPILLWKVKFNIFFYIERLFVFIVEGWIDALFLFPTMQR